jgi:muconate cycloisomerase
MKIAAIEAFILDIPIIRPHHLSFGTKTGINAVIVRLQTDDGVEGLGEAVASAGPAWNEESAETIQLVIERYLAPELIGEDPSRIERINEKMARRARGNLFAKAAVEMACFDALGKSVGEPVYKLLGGLYRDRIPLSWSLASGDAEFEINEAQKLIERGHFIFKIKMGELEPKADLARVKRIVEAIGSRARLRVDANQGWDEITATQSIPALEEWGIELIEQPVPRWNVDGMARLARRFDIPIMADEAVCTVHDAVSLVKAEAADIFALKLTKAGGLAASKAVAAVAKGAGLPCYIGCMTETGLGTAAYAHFGASTPGVTFGCELFGPLLLTEDIVQTPIRYAEGHVYVTSGPGFGIHLDEAQVKKFRRKV